MVGNSARGRQGTGPGARLGTDSLVRRTLRSSMDDPAVAVRLAAVNAVRDIGDRERRPRRGCWSIAIGMSRSGWPPPSAGDVGGSGSRLPSLIAAIRASATPEPVRDAARGGVVETIGSDAAVKALVELLEAGAAGPRGVLACWPPWAVQGEVRRGGHRRRVGGSDARSPQGRG